MSSLKNEFMNTHDLYSTGQEMQMVRDETGALRAQLVPPPPPPVATATPEGEMQFGTVGEAVKDLPRAMAGAAPGLVTGGVRGIAEAAALVVSAIPGAYAAYKAGDGEGLQSYLNVLQEHSNKYGGGKVKALADSALDMMGVSEEDKEQFNLAANVGEIYGVGEGLVKAPVVATRVARDVIRRQRGAASELGAIGPEIQAKIDPRKTIAMQPREVIEALDDETRGIIRDLATEKRAAETVAPGLDDTQIITGDELLRTLQKAQKKIPTRKQDELGFYSRAQEFIDNLKQEKLSGPQLKGQMLNAGVKADELKWTGLDEFLEANPKLTKQEAMDFIDQNKVKLEEITYKGATLEPGTYQNFSDAEVIDDYEEIKFQRERIDDEINSGDDDYLEMAIENLYNDADVPSHVAAYKELMQATGGNPNAEGFDAAASSIEAKYPDVNVRSLIFDVDDQLDDIARETYFSNPYYEVNGEGMLEDYRIVGNDDTGYYVTYQSEPVDIIDVYSLNEAQVQVQQDAIDRGLDTGAGDTQYSEYTQEGAENYREVLLTNPSYKGDPSFKLNEAQEARLKELGDKIQAEKERRPSQIVVRPYEALGVAEANEFEALQKQQRLSNVMENRMPSPHWQEDDVIAHARLSDRTVMGGERIDVEGGIQRIPEALYIEELQSDWAQIGRRRGFGATEKEFYIYEAKDPRTDETYFVVYDIKGDQQIGDVAPVVFIRGQQRFATRKQAEEAIEYEKKMMPKRVGTPEGPLVGKTDKWTEMSMRRLIRKAADEGYDYIAWTPGDVQFDRWNEEGLETYYDKVLPKATGNVAKKLDKEAKVEDIEISIDGDPQTTKALRITDKLKTMAKEGQPLFAVPAAVGVGAALKPKEETDGNL